MEKYLPLLFSAIALFLFGRTESGAVLSGCFLGVVLFDGLVIAIRKLNR
jgi:hypothetical protein